MAERLLDFGVRFEGMEAPIARLGLAESRVGDLRPAWRAIHDGSSAHPYLAGGGLSFVDIMRAQYATQGARGGRSWAGYDDEPVYSRIKIAFGGGLGRILRWRPGRERLYPSLVAPSHAEHVYRPDRLGVTIGTSVPYARRLHFGIGEQPFDRIPLTARAIIALTRSDFRAWVRVIQRHVAGTVGVPGARADIPT